MSRRAGRLFFAAVLLASAGHGWPGAAGAGRAGAAAIVSVCAADASPLAPLPPPPSPAENPATPDRVALGKMLFFDRRLSGAGKAAPLSPLGLTREDKEALKALLAEALSGDVGTVRPPALP